MHEFSVSGRLIDQQQIPFPGLLVTIIDRDLIWDDLIAYGLTNQNGEFLTHYLESDFQQEIAELESQPDLSIIISFFDSSKKCYIPFKKIEIESKQFQAQLYLGDIILTTPFTKINKLHSLPGHWGKSIRLNLDDTGILDYCLNSILKIIEDSLQYKIDQNDFSLRALSQSEIAHSYFQSISAQLPEYKLPSFLIKVIGKLFYHRLLGLYDPFQAVIYINKQKLKYQNIDTLKAVIGHELIHFIQFYKNPDLRQKMIDMYKKYFEYLKQPIPIPTLLELSYQYFLNEIQPFMTTIEGDAFYFEQNILRQILTCSNYTHISGVFDGILAALLKSINPLQETKIYDSHLIDRRYIEGSRLVEQNQHYFYI